MSAGNPNADPGIPQGFFLSGDAEVMAAITPDRIEMLREMVGGLGLALTVQHGEATQSDVAPELDDGPVAITREGFFSFAAQHGYTKARAKWAWSNVAETHWQTETAWLTSEDLVDTPDSIGLNLNPHMQRYARWPIRWLNEDPNSSWDDRILDLRSVHERLVETSLTNRAWRGGANGAPQGFMDFLAHMVNEIVKPDEPLPVSSMPSPPHAPRRR
jgi:hypothetical protein